MRRWIAVFLVGFTAGIWTDAALVEWVDDTTVYEFFVGPSIEFNHEVIEDALDPVDEGVDDSVPDSDWYNKAVGRFRSA